MIEERIIKLLKKNKNGLTTSKITDTLNIFAITQMRRILRKMERKGIVKSDRKLKGYQKFKTNKVKNKHQQLIWSLKN